MTTRYEVVEARDHKEAERLSKWKVGALVEVVAVEVVANPDRTFTVFPICKPIEENKYGK